jgi:hypothetical protein
MTATKLISPLAKLLPHRKEPLRRRLLAARLAALKASAGRTARAP